MADVHDGEGHDHDHGEHDHDHGEHDHDHGEHDHDHGEHDHADHGEHDHADHADHDHADHADHDHADHADHDHHDHHHHGGSSGPGGHGHRAKVLTVSDGVVAGTREDRSGAALVELLAGADFTVVETMVVADGVASVTGALRRLCDRFTGLVVTTGGTGFGPRDLTPEATAAVLEREAPGLAEAMRAVSPKGALSRGRAGTVGTTLVVNLPGSPGGAVESLASVLGVLPHALDLLAGARPEGPHVVAVDHTDAT